MTRNGMSIDLYRCSATVSFSQRCRDWLRHPLNLTRLALYNLLRVSHERICVSIHHWQEYLFNSLFRIAKRKHCGWVPLQVIWEAIPCYDVIIIQIEISNWIFNSAGFSVAMDLSIRFHWQPYLTRSNIYIHLLLFCVFTTDPAYPIVT